MNSLQVVVYDEFNSYSTITGVIEKKSASTITSITEHTHDNHCSTLPGGTGGSPGSFSYGVESRNMDSAAAGVVLGAGKLPSVSFLTELPDAPGLNPGNPSKSIVADGFGGSASPRASASPSIRGEQYVSQNAARQTAKEEISQTNDSGAPVIAPPCYCTPVASIAPTYYVKPEGGRCDHERVA